MNTPPSRPDDEAASPEDGGGDARTPDGRAGGQASRDAALVWRGVKYFAYGVGGLLLTVLTLVGIALLLLQTEWGSRVAKNLILAQVNPLGEARLEIDDIDGNWISHLELKGLRLVRSADATPAGATPADAASADAASADAAARESVRMVQVDSLEASYDLLALLNGRVALGNVHLYGPDARLTQQADGTWDLTEAFASEQPAPDTTASNWQVRLDDLQIRRGQLAARFYTQSGRDSTLRVQDFSTDVRDLAIGGPEAPRVDLRSLTAHFTPPGQTLERRFALSGQLRERHLTMRQLALDSPYSNVSGSGTLVLPGAEGGPVRNIDFQLEGQPLSFRDLAGFVPSLDASRSVRFDFSAEGTSERLKTAFEARFSDGSSAALSGTVQPGMEDGPLAYDLEGQVRQLDPGFFTQGAEMGHINSNFSADLRGASAQQLSGTARVELFDTRIGEYSLNPSYVAARFSDGTATIDAEGGLRGASFAAEGALQPFADPLAYDLTGQFQDVNLGRLTNSPGQQSDLDGRVQFQGYGTSLAEANLTAQLALQPSTLNRFQVQEGQFTVRLIDGKMNLEARMRSPQGQARVAGNAWLDEDPLRYQISEGRLENVDVAALAGDTTRSQITATVRLQGRGTSPQTLRLDVATLQLTDSYYGPYVINTTSLDAQLTDGRLTLDGQADLDGGTFELQGASLRPFQPMPSFEVESASFSNVNIGQLGQYPGTDVQQSSDLNGRVSLEGRGSEPQTMFLTGSAHLSDSRLNRQEINSAAVELTLRDGQLAYTAALNVPEGQTRLAGTLRPFAEDPAFAIQEGTFEGLNVGALAGVEGLNTNLRGQILALEGTGFSLEALRANARIDLSGSTINEATLTEGTLELDAEGGVAQLQADFQFEGGGRADLEGRLNRSGEALSYRLDGTIDRLDTGPLLGDSTAGGRFTAHLNVEGTGTNPRTATSRGRLAVTGGRFGAIDVRRLALDYTLEEGLLVVDTLAVNSNVVEAAAQGALALYDRTGRYATDFSFRASVDSLGPVRPFVGDSIRALAVGENAVTGRLVSAPAGPLRLQADARLQSLVYNDIRLSDFEGALRATVNAVADTAGASGLLVALDELSVEAIRNAQVRGKAGYLATGSFSTRQADFDAIYAGDEVDLEASVKIDEERDFRLAGVIDPRAGQERIRLDALNVRFGPDRWQLLQEASITYGEQYRVSNLLLYTGDGQQLAVDGVVDFDGRQSLVFTLEQFRIASVADLLGYDDLGGTVSGALTLSGPAQDPALTGSLTLDVDSGGENVGELRLALDYANQRLGIDARLENRDQSTLTAEGYLPMDLRLSRSGALADTPGADSAAAGPDSSAIGEDDSPVDIAEVRADTVSVNEVALAVEADSFAVQWIHPFLDPEQIEDLGGLLTADIDIGGTLDAPRLEGTAALTGGTLQLAALGATYEDIRAQLRFTGDQVQLREAVLETGDGRLTAQGAINLQALTLGELDLAIDAEDFQAVRTAAYRATVDADLEVQGTTEAPDVRGSVDVRSADIYLDAFGAGGDYTDVPLTDEDLRELRRNFGVRVTEADTSQSDVYRALAMQVDVELGRNTWLHSTSNPELDIQFEGDLDLQKAREEDLQLFGSIEVIPERSRVVQFGKRFDITTGVLTFNGAPTEPSLDLEAAYDVAARRSRGSEVTITLSVSGRPEDLNFELGSEPNMETTDILSYIATGRPASESFVGGGGGGAEGVVTGLAFGQVANLVEGLAGEQGLGLDIIEIEQDPQSGTLFTAGEYIYIESLPHPLFVAVSQPITGGAGGLLQGGQETEVTLEYEVTDGLLVRFLRREAIRLNLRFEYAY